MNILWIKVGGLWPLNTGGRLRSYHIVSELSQRHRVTVLTTHGPGEDPEALSKNLPQCERVLSFPFNAPKQGTVRFARALIRSWFSRFSVDLWKWRIAVLQSEASRLLSAGAIDLCVADFLVSVPNVPLNHRIPTVF